MRHLALACSLCTATCGTAAPDTSTGPSSTATTPLVSTATPAAAPTSNQVDTGRSTPASTPAAVSGSAADGGAGNANAPLSPTTVSADNAGASGATRAGAGGSAGVPASDSASADAAGTSGASAGAVAQNSGTASEDRDPTPADFTCTRGSDWTQVGNARFKNYLGHGDEMLAVARSKSGRVFPVGTIVQLVPTEASVKRAAGFSAASHDWEFFNLSVSSTGAMIGAHGGDSMVINSFGLSCLDCHQKAAPQWDLICGSADGQSHGCDPLPLSGDMLAALDDARCP